MSKDYLLTAYRNLRRFKIDSILNISGLVIGLTAALLLGLFVRHEFSYDRFWQDAEHLYRVQVRWVVEGRDDIDLVNSPGPLKAALQAYFPNEIQAAARLFQRSTVVYHGAASYNDTVTLADPEILDIFNFEILAGDARVALADNAAIILNETLAYKYFGDADPIGKILTLDNRLVRRDYQVRAVMRDLPFNTHLDLQALVRLEENDYASSDNTWMFARWNAARNHTYIKLYEDSVIATLAGKIDDFTDANLTASRGKPSDRTKFTPIAVTDIHLYSEAAGGMKPGGDINVVYAFTVVALLIVVVAIVNYVNLSTARAGQRAGEISIRKIMGATRSQLVSQHLGESFLVAGFAVLLAILVVELTLPVFNQWLQLELGLRFGDPLVLAGVLLTTLAVGGLSGLYPALVLSFVKPSGNLVGSGPRAVHGTAKIRNALVVFQTAVTVALVVATTVVYAQLTFFHSLERGFDPNQLLVIKGMDSTGMKGQSETFRTLVEQLPGVQSASLSYEAPTHFNENNTSLRLPGGDEDTRYSIGCTMVDPYYLETLGIPLLAGRFYRADIALDHFPHWAANPGDDLLQGNIVLNERAVDALSLGTPQEAIGQVVESRYRLSEGRTGRIQQTIIGVIGNAKLHSAKVALRPEVYRYEDVYFHLLVRYSGAGSTLLPHLLDTWLELMPGEPFEYFFVDQALGEEFQSESSQAGIFLAFALLTMVIGCLGLYGLAAFVTECRRREIGIRKVLGAGVTDILGLLFGQFSLLLAIANLVAWPVAYLLMSDWLSQYPFRIDSAWILAFCLLAGLLSTAVVALTVGSQAVTAARSNPIDAIRLD